MVQSDFLQISVLSILSLLLTFGFILIEWFLPAIELAEVAKYSEDELDQVAGKFAGISIKFSVGIMAFTILLVSAITYYNVKRWKMLTGAKTIV